MLRSLIVTATLALAPLGAMAQSSDAEVLLDVMDIGGVIDIMRAEGIAYGAELRGSSLPGGGSQGWDATISRIYDTDRMTEQVRARFVEEIGDTDVGPLIEFFSTDAGRELIILELSAREAMTDEAVEDAAKDAFREVDADPRSDRLKQIDAFVAVNDLVDANVVGALNAQFQFYRGLVDAGGAELGDEDILRDVWEQEAETRTDTREWVYGFLLLAYKPVEDKVLDEYIRLSGTEAGEALNRALFASFDVMYADISYALGLALGREMQVQDL